MAIVIARDIIRLENILDQGENTPDDCRYEKLSKIVSEVFWSIIQFSCTADSADRFISAHTISLSALGRISRKSPKSGLLPFSAIFLSIPVHSVTFRERIAEDTSREAVSLSWKAVTLNGNNVVDNIYDYENVIKETSDSATGTMFYSGRTSKSIRADSVLSPLISVRTRGRTPAASRVIAIISNRVVYHHNGENQKMTVTTGRVQMAAGWSGPASRKEERARAWKAYKTSSRCRDITLGHGHLANVLSISHLWYWIDRRNSDCRHEIQDPLRENAGI